MIPRISVQLEGEALAVELATRPVDLFAAEEAVGFDPLGELTTASAVGTVNTRVLKGLIALAWAAYTRTHESALSLEVFTQRLETMPTVVTEPEGEEAARPTPAVASTG